MTYSHLHAAPIRNSRPGTSPFKSPLAWLRLALEARRQRRTLASLPEDRLADLGLTEEQRRLEAMKPVWNVPAHWLR